MQLQRAGWHVRQRHLDVHQAVFPLRKREAVGHGALRQRRRRAARQPAHGQRGKKGRLLLKGGIVLTLDKAIGDFLRGDVLI